MWQNLLQTLHDQTVERGESLPYEAVIQKVRWLGSRLRMSETVFPVSVLLAMLERYSIEYQKDVGPPTWVVDLFLDLEVPHDRLYSTLETMFYNEEAPFQGPNRGFIAQDLLYLIRRWFHDTVRMGGIVFGDESMAEHVSETLLLLQQSGLNPELLQVGQELRAQIEDILR
jgi:nuclear pore complex protein Nup155